MFIVENGTVMTNYPICLQLHELYLGSRQLLIIKAKLQGNGRTCGDDVVLNPMVSRGGRLADIHHFRKPERPAGTAPLLPPAPLLRPVTAVPL
jgi:hypothetical protein